MDTELRRFESYFFQAKAANDPAQVPLAGAVLYATRQGASATETVIFNEQEEHDVVVVDAGLIRVGDELFMDVDTSVQLSVLAVSADRTTLTLQNLGGFMGVSAGARLRPVDDPPALYKDPRGLQPVGGGSVAVDAVGYGWFYTPTTLVDLSVVGGGLAAPRLLTNRRCGWLRGAETWRNANDYASIQAAIDSLPDVGGTVFIPAGIYDLSETLYTPCDRPCHLVGEGSSRSGTKGTVLRWSVNTGMLRVRGDDSSVRGLTLRMMASGVAAAEHQGCGIFVGRRSVVDAHPHPGTSPTATEYVKGGSAPLYRLVLDDVVVMDAPGWGLTIPGFGTQTDGQPEYGRVVPGPGVGGTLSFWIDVTRVQLARSRKYGALFTGGGCTTLHFTGGACLQQGVGETGYSEPTAYAHLRGTLQPVFRDWIFEGRSPAGDATGLTMPWVVLHGCEAASFETCWFENDPHGSAPTESNYDPQYFLYLLGLNRSITMRQLLMTRAGMNQGFLRCVYCAQDGVDGLYVDQPYAISSTLLTQEVQPTHFVPIDVEAFVLNGEDDSDLGENRNIFIRGAGVATDLVQTDPQLLRVPLTYSSIPDSASIANRQSLRVPLSAFADRTNGKPDVDAMLAQSGALATEELVDGNLLSRTLLFSSGGEAKWRLANNLPSLTSAQRNARDGWVTGDLILNTVYPRVEVFDGSGWRAVSGILPLSEE